tara:strand:- start:98 stop:385 length:288 start_codon:yes stop_codon:yes gene_type:complete
MKAFENDRIVPIASARLSSAGTCERISHSESRMHDRKLYPVLDQGVMMSAQNWQAYFDAQRRERVHTAMQEVREKMAARQTKPSQVATVLPFKGE